MTKARISGRRVIPASELGEIVSAKDVLRDAQRRLAEVEDMRHAAVEAGRQEGYEAGLRQYEQAGARAISALIERAEAAMLDVEGPIARLAEQIVEKLIGAMPEAERIRGLTNQALRDIDYPGPVRLHVAAAVEDLFDDAQPGLDRRLTIVVDPLLKRDELVLEFSNQRMQIGLANQLRHVREMFGRE